MRFLVVPLLITLLILMGCAPQTQLTVKLASPAHGSEVTSLAPMLIWGGGDTTATYRLLVAADSNFQNLVIDASNLGEPRYTIPSRKLLSDKTYYWKVIASKGNVTSDWSSSWSFKTPAAPTPSHGGKIRVSATVDGVPWSGAVNYSITGPFSDTDNSLPWNFDGVPAGTYTITYNYGAPAGKALANVSPSPTQNLPDGGVISFVLNFYTQSTSQIAINATLNGTPWSGPINYSISGPFNDTETLVPQTLNSLPTGNYTLVYNYGGPAGAALSNITPATVQTLTSGGSLVYTLNFSTSPVSNLSVTASLNGAPWSGPIRYSLSGRVSISRTDVPFQLNNAPAGTYQIVYEGGGPQGATLGGITPAQTITLTSGISGGFVLNFYTQPVSGNIVVSATLNGSPWSGGVNYFISGPLQNSDNTVPRTYTSIPAGTYTLTYSGGGPAGAMLASITPSPSQRLDGGRTIAFTMNFITQPGSGTINVNALLDGQPWRVAIGSGSINYTLIGPKHDSSTTVPQTFSNMPAGPYTLNYNGGGPIGATLTSITPSPSQNLSSGGAITFTLNFTGQPKGTVIVNATLNGQPWSGQVGYIVQGPYVESGSSTPRNFTGAPAGSYSVQYRSGGPPQSIFEGVTPSTQILPAGGTITFTIMFKFQGLPPQPPAPGPLPGPLVK